MLNGFLKNNLNPKKKIKEVSFGENFISNILLGLIILLPIFYLPLKFSALSASKLTLVLSVVFVSVIVVLINFFKLGKIQLSLNLISASIFLIIVSYTISAIFSQNSLISFFGRDFSLDSWVTIISLFTLLCLFRHYIKKEHIMFSLVGVVLVSGIVSALQILNIIIPSLPSLGIFYSSISTTLGKWNDLALFVAFGTMLAVLLLEQITITQRFKYILYTVGVLNLFMIALINFNLSLIMLAIFGIVFSFYKFFNREKQKSKILDEKSKVPLISIGVAIFSILYLFLGTPISQSLSLFLNINHIEARPSVSTTIEVTKLSLPKYNIYFGAGPSTFEAVWPIYRPAEVLITDFWNLDFRYGAGIVSSFVTTTGLVGLFVWSVFFILLLVLFIKSLLFKHKDEYLKFILSTTAFATIALWIFAIFYITSATLFVMAFIFTGMFLSVARDLDLFKSKSVDFNRFITTIFTVVCILITVFLAYKTYTKFIGQVYFQKSVQLSVVSGDYNELERVIKKAQYFDDIDTYSRSLGEIYTARFYQIVQNSSEVDITTSQLQDLIQKVVSSYEGAIAYDPGNYNNYFGLGNFYSDLARFSVPGAGESALNSYGKVVTLKPLNPILYLQMAKLASMSDFILAEELIRRAISLKPNYFDAISALVQLEIEDGDRSEALEILENYLDAYPGDLEAIFQTGLIYYEMRSFDLAVNSFESILSINPNVQNARYFLGLSYYELGQTTKSVEHFEVLAGLNPENIEIQSMLQSLKSGNSLRSDEVQDEVVPTSDIEVDIEKN